MENYRSKLRPRMRPASKQFSVLRLQTPKGQSARKASKQDQSAESESKQCIRLQHKHNSSAVKSKRCKVKEVVSIKRSFAHSFIGNKNSANRKISKFTAEKFKVSSVFLGLIEWKKRHTRDPVTSTPNPNLPPVSQKDIQTCFGFVSTDSTDGHKSSFISPIKCNSSRSDAKIKRTRIV